MDINRRNYYRVSYPETERPRFVFGTSISEVMQCSERGLRFRTAGPVPIEGSEISGRFAMRHGCEVRIAGRVVWSDENTVALNLDNAPIPFLAVMREQIYLRRAREQQQQG
jgi:hypothetical protein